MDHRVVPLLVYEVDLAVLAEDDEHSCGVEGVQLEDLAVSSREVEHRQLLGGLDQGLDRSAVLTPRS